MELRELTWKGPPIDDQGVLDQLPDEYAALLRQANGFVQFGGGLHVRGICREPLWHSLQHVWTGALALHSLYQCLSPKDVPFAEEPAGDQFILREGSVCRLQAGTDELEPVSPTLLEFMSSAQIDPVRFLGLQPLVQFQREGGVLQPGESISVYPPFAFEESAAGVSVEAFPSLELIRIHADLARQISNLPIGARIKVSGFTSPRRRWWQRGHW